MLFALIPAYFVSSSFLPGSPSVGKLRIPASPGRSNSVESCASPSSLKSDLLDRAEKVQRGFRATRDDLAGLRTVVEALERMTPEQAPVESPRLPGVWSLVYTDAFDVLNLGRLPIELGDITQEIRPGDSNGTFIALNTICFEPLGAAYVSATLGLRAAAKYTVRGDCRSLGDGRRVSLLFTGGSFEPEAQLIKQGVELPLPPFNPSYEALLPASLTGVLQPLLQERVFLETSFLDEDLRVARGPGSEIWALRRAPAASMPGTAGFA